VVANMTTIQASLLAALLFLAIGVCIRSFFLRNIYPVLSDRHEAAKMNLEVGMNPAMIAALVQLSSYILLPVIGYVAFGPVVRTLIGSL
jgi:hypothetical protein